MAKKTKGARAFNRWRTSQLEPVSIAAVAEAVGDKGGQLFKWASGERNLPLHLLIAVSRHTGIPLEDLAERKQLAIARELAALAGKADAGGLVGGEAAA